MEIEYWINEITYSECEPCECRNYDYGNETLVKHWGFRGDEPNGIISDQVDPQLVRRYIDYCEKQIFLAKQYLLEVED